MRSSTETIIKALRILAADIQSGDGVANAAIAEAADRLEELSQDNVKAEPLAYYCKNDPERETAFHWKPGKCSNCGGVLQPLYAEPVEQSARIAELIAQRTMHEEIIRMTTQRCIELANGITHD